MAADTAPATPGSFFKGWLKTALGTIGGVLSGACVVYFTAFIDRTVKPSKPTPNFRTVPAGLTVQFQNLSQSGDGWWDFGDGSPLEPVSDDHAFVSHTFPKAGDYTVRMTLHNLLNEEAERSVTVHVSGDAASNDLPEIESLTVTPFTAGSCAPATFDIQWSIKNAQVRVIDFGNNQPLDITSDPNGSQQRSVIFQKPGSYIVKVAAIKGKKYQEKTAVVTVVDAPIGSATAMLTVTGTATRIEAPVRPFTFAQSFPREVTGDVYPFQRSWPASPGYSFADIRLKSADGREVVVTGQQMNLDVNQLGLHNARNLQITFNSDRTSVMLSGELVRAPAGKSQSAKLVLPATIMEQRKVPVTLNPQSVTTVIPIPVSGAPSSVSFTYPSLESGLENVQRHALVQVSEPGAMKWHDVSSTGATKITLGAQEYLVSVHEQGEQVRVDLQSAPSP